LLQNESIQSPISKADAANHRRQRNLLDGEVEMLQGFEYNMEGKLCITLYAPYMVAINRVAGTLEVTILAFVPINRTAPPSGSRHFKVKYFLFLQKKDIVNFGYELVSFLKYERIAVTGIVGDLGGKP